MRWIIFLLFLLMPASSSLAMADDTTMPATNFPNGTFALTLEADYAHSFDLSPARMESGLVGVGYYFLDNVAVNVEAAGFSVQQPGPDSIITEIDLKLRHTSDLDGVCSDPIKPMLLATWVIPVQR